MQKKGIHVKHFNRWICSLALSLSRCLALPQCDIVHFENLLMSTYLPSHPLNNQRISSLQKISFQCNLRPLSACDWHPNLPASPAPNRQHLAHKPLVVDHLKPIHHQPVALVQ